jgi:DNA-binding GntR family transcriptional regulator
MMLDFFEVPDKDPENSESLTQHAYHVLRYEILNGTLRPGYRLVRRKEAERLGLSPMPVSQAFHKLELDGLVEDKPMVGCRVKPFTYESIQNSRQLREALECHVARLCAVNIGSGIIKQLREIAQKVDLFTQDAVDDCGGEEELREKGLMWHVHFHQFLAANCGSPIMEEELRRVWFHKLSQLNWINSSQCLPTPSDWHQNLVDAIAMGDPDFAEKKMREHVSFGRETIDKAFEIYSQNLHERQVV